MTHLSLERCHEQQSTDISSQQQYNVTSRPGFGRDRVNFSLIKSTSCKGETTTPVFSSGATHPYLGRAGSRLGFGN